MFFYEEQISKYFHVYGYKVLVKTSQCCCCSTEEITENL